MPRPLPHPSRDELDIGVVLHALSDPMRRAVVVVLAEGGAGTSRHCSSFGLPVTKATRTHHFRVLRESGLIRMEDLGNRRMTSLRRDDLEARFPGLLRAVVAEGVPSEADLDPAALEPVA